MGDSSMNDQPAPTLVAMADLDSLVRALSSVDPTVRQQAAMRLGAIDASPAMPELVTAMATEPDDFVRETLIWAVVARPEAATAQLLAALSAGVPKEPVLHALSKIGDPATVPSILPFADDADPVVAAKAWWALGRIGTPEALPALLRHLGPEQAEQRHALTRALLEVGAPAVDALAERLDHPDTAVRWHAAEILVALSDATRASTAERRAGSDVAARAAAVLRGSGTPEVDGALLMATVDEDRPGLVQAAQTLRDERG